MADSQNLARELSTLSPRELASVLNTARELRRADPSNVIADWNALYDFEVCPFCGTRTDTICIDYKLFLVLISDAYGQGANTIVIRCEESNVIVTYDNSPDSVPRDTMPARHWHQIMAGIHVAFARNAFHDGADSTLDQNFLPLSETVADFDELRRVALKSSRPIPAGIRIMCADGLTSIHFEP